MSGPKAKEHTFQRIKTIILDKINRQEWKPGDRIPGEEALAAEFQCARMTVHRAMRELSDMGIIERKRRAGTRVALRQRRPASIEIPRVDIEVIKLGYQYRYQLLTREIIVPTLQQQTMLALDPNKEALHIRCIHYANDAPWQLEERWINLNTVPNAANQSFEDSSPSNWMLENTPWTNAEHIISAINADSHHADLLQINERDALMSIQRKTWHEDTLLTQAHLVHPGRLYQLSASPSLG